jgi:hypothetical protein
LQQGSNLVVRGLVSRRRHLLLELVLGPTIQEVALLMEEVLEELFANPLVEG